jgi:hypothetical protein
MREVPSSAIICQLLCYNTDTHHTGSYVEQNQCWRDTAPSSCITKQLGERSSHLISHISTIMFEYRRSLRWTLAGVKSAMKGHITWLMHYSATWWGKFYIHQSYITYYFSLQALITLDLSGNYISDKGAQYLAHALQSNVVREVLYSSVTCKLLCFNTDTHHVASWMEQNRCGRGTILGSCITNQCGEITLILTIHISTIMLKYRHSPHLILEGTISATMRHNI